MKILLIHLEDDKELVNWYISFLGKLNISAQILPVKFPSAPEETIMKQFTSVFGLSVSEEEEIMPQVFQNTAGTTHVIILSALSPRWFDFFAGFTYGSHFPLLVYGEKAASLIPGEFSDHFIIYKTEEDIKKYFELEVEILKKREILLTKKKARDTLLEKGIPVNEESMARCAAQAYLTEVDLFLKVGFSPDTRDKTGIPVLNIAARTGNGAVIDLLIHSGAQVNALAADRGSSPLIDAVIAKHKDIMADLIRAGAELNIRSKDGQSALIIAVGIGDEEMVTMLLKAGADPDLSDNLGVSARKYASLFHKARLLDLFNTFSPAKAV